MNSWCFSWCHDVLRSLPRVLVTTRIPHRQKWMLEKLSRHNKLPKQLKQHTHNPSCHESYQKWMELCRTATRNCETNFVAFVNTKLLCEFNGWFRAGSDLATGFILGLQLLGTPETRLRRERRQTAHENHDLHSQTAALRPCTSTRVHPSGLYARCFEWLGESLRFSHSETRKLLTVLTVLTTFGAHVFLLVLTLHFCSPCLVATFCLNECAMNAVLPSWCQISWHLANSGSTV